MKKICNLGCGRRFHLDCVNVDHVACDPRVISHNLLEPLPFEGSSFDVVYHSHVLEHFDVACGRRFLQECRHVLKPGGVLRIAVPDLEGIARAYLVALECARETGSLADLHWMQLELFDQMVRRKSGGEMGRWFAKEDIPNKEFVVARLGREVEGWIGSPAQGVAGKSRARHTGRLAGLRKALSKHITRALCRFLRVDEDELKTMQFRRTGENHLWMYDEITLTAALRELGFVNVIRRDASTSYIDDWGRYGLDADLAGVPHKPDSLYLEAQKP